MALWRSLHQASGRVPMTFMPSMTQRTATSVRAGVHGRPQPAKGVPPPLLLEFAAMRLEGIQAGDIVEVDRKGRRFHAVVTGAAPGGLALAPLERRVNYYSCRSREVIGHWARRGRPRATAEPLLPSPRQLQLELEVAPQEDQGWG